MTKPGNVVCEGDVCRYVTDTQDPSPVSEILSQLLGDELLGKDGKAVATASVTGPEKIVGLYFSAHWCGPCRGFTPALAKHYLAFKENHPRKQDLNIVFVSSDRDEASFTSYYSEMPWLALPYAKRDLKAKLSSKFKVQGIPTLIILDGASGEVITSSGRDAILNDPEGADFPWRTPTFAEVVADAELVSKEGETFKAKEALDSKVKLVYFSAHWCPPCRRFTPMLVETYKKLKAAGKKVEVIFVSGDRDEASFKKYLEEMPWLALPLSDTARIGKLNTAFEVDGIPTLVVLDEDDKVITSNGVGAVQADPEGSGFPWHPKPLDQLSSLTLDLVNQGQALILYVDAEDDAAAKVRATQVLGELADRTKAAVKGQPSDAKDLSFLFGRLGDELLGRVLQYAHVGEEAKPGSGDGMFVLDVPSQAVYRNDKGVAVTAESADELVKSLLAGELTKFDL